MDNWAAMIIPIPFNPALNNLHTGKLSFQHPVQILILAVSCLLAACSSVEPPLDPGETSIQPVETTPAVTNTPPFLQNQSVRVIEGLVSSAGSSGSRNINNEPIAPGV